MSDYWEKRLSANFNSKGVGYIGLTKSYNRWLYFVRRVGFLFRVKRHLGDVTKADVLDIGSGTGFYIKIWEELCARSISGADLTQTAVSNLSNTFPKHLFYQLDIGQIPLTGPLKDTKYDIISIMDVLYHITDDTQYRNAFLNLYHFLKPGGLLVFSENFVQSNTQRAAHQVSRTLAEISAILRDVGLINITRFPQFYFMNAPVDTKSKILIKVWRLLRKLAGSNEIVGWCMGILFVPFEILLVLLLRESISSELMICRRPAIK